MIMGPIISFQMPLLVGSFGVLAFNFLKLKVKSEREISVRELSLVVLQ